MGKSLKFTVLCSLWRLAIAVYEALRRALLSLYPIHVLWQRRDLSDLEFGQRKHTEQKGLQGFEYSLFSQNGEDGIIRHLFSQIGTSSKQFLEFGFEPVENNTLRLMLQEGWSGVLIDGSQSSVRLFNDGLRRLGRHDVRAIHQFLDLNNLRRTIVETGSLTGEIDLLSIDVDGNDYWFWKDITYVDPRVVVIEYNSALGPTASITVQYDPQFNLFKKHPSGFYHGASLTALTELADYKGYALVGCDSVGVNAFFVRKDCLSGSIKGLSPAAAFRAQTRGLKSRFSLEEQYSIIGHLPFVAVTRQDLLAIA